MPPRKSCMKIGVEKGYWLSVGGEEFEATVEEEALYRKAVQVAKEAFASPDQSGFHVLTCAMAADGSYVTGGNKEYALSDAFVHGETAVLTAFHDRFGRKPIKVLAFYSKFPVEKGGSACPCGNCRDVMAHYCSPDMLIIEGNEEHALISRFSEYQFSDFATADPRNPVLLTGLREGVRALKESKTVYLPETLKNNAYGVVIVSRNGRMWRGSLYTNAGYDAITPALSAIQTWKNTTPHDGTNDHLDIDHILIVGKGKIPHVFYRDRQAILEFDEVLRQYSGRTQPLPIHLVNIDDEQAIVEANQTNAVEWLPHPFSPESFGMQDVIAAEAMLYLSNK